MFARSGGNGFDKQVRDQPLPQLQLKTAGSVRGSLHQVQARKYDHMLDIVHLERSALRPTKDRPKAALYSFTVSVCSRLYQQLHAECGQHLQYCAERWIHVAAERSV